MKKESKIISGILIAVSLFLVIGCDTGSSGTPAVTYSIGGTSAVTYAIGDTGPSGVGIVLE